LVCSLRVCDTHGERNREGGFNISLKTTMERREKAEYVRLPVRDEGGVSVVEGLSPYDMVREPRPLVQDERTLSMPLLEFNKELQCPVCLGVLNKTVTVTECLHRFCSECINSSLRLGKKECPTCRQPCPTRRDTRPDAAMDALVDAMFGDLAEYQQNVSNAMMEARKRAQQSLQSTFREGIQRQSALLEAERRRIRRGMLSFFLAYAPDCPKGSQLVHPALLHGGEGTWVSVGADATIREVHLLLLQLYSDAGNEPALLGSASVAIDSDPSSALAPTESLRTLRKEAMDAGQDLQLQFRILP